MDISENNFGFESVQVPITSVRVHRTDGKWLVEYRRVPKYYIDKWWWFNDGTYVEYADARARVNTLLRAGYVTFVKYSRVKQFEVE
jgi:hypothetical protein